MVANQVEIGFDVSGSSAAPFVTLNDPVKGLLNSADYVLGGTLYYDVTSKLLRYNISRGKSRQLDRYPAGKLSIELDNTDRTFDPLYSGSPYVGQVIPRRPVRITSNGNVQIIASIDDWDLAYQINGMSTATAKASDSLTQLANQPLDGGLQVSEYAGARIKKILDAPEVNWPPSDRDLDVGRTLLQADTIAAGTNALTYIQKLSETEPGSFYVSKNGDARFKDRYSSAADGEVSFTDDGTGIPYTNLRVVYGAELLSNDILVQRLSGGNGVASNASSQEQYGIFNLTIANALMEEDTNAQFLADFLIAKYAQPEYRFESLEVELNEQSETVQNQILGLELGDVVTIVFTPSGIGDAIDRTVEVIRISQRVSPTKHTVEFGFGALEVNFWRLSDPIFGRLSKGNSLAY